MEELNCSNCKNKNVCKLHKRGRNNCMGHKKCDRDCLDCYRAIRNHNGRIIGCVQ